MNFEAAKEFVLTQLQEGLKPDLFYHCYHHTLDVYEASKKIAGLENVTGIDLILLETAALYHDTGFLLGYTEHEGQSAIYARKHLPEFGYTVRDIEIICSMIHATKLPQSPHNLLERILCDADLDYLGRDDFFMIANRLLCEWNKNGLPTTLKKWYHIQVDFLANNNYYTESARELRRDKKKENLSQIIELLS